MSFTYDSIKNLVLEQIEYVLTDEDISENYNIDFNSDTNFTAKSNLIEYILNYIMSQYDNNGHGFTPPSTTSNEYDPMDQETRDKIILLKIHNIKSKLIEYLQIKKHEFITEPNVFGRRGLIQQRDILNTRNEELTLNQETLQEEMTQESARHSALMEESKAELDAYEANLATSKANLARSEAELDANSEALKESEFMKQICNDELHSAQNQNTELIAKMAHEFMEFDTQLKIAHAQAYLEAQAHAEALSRAKAQADLDAQAQAEALSKAKAQADLDAQAQAEALSRAEAQAYLEAQAHAEALKSAEDCEKALSKLQKDTEGLTKGQADKLENTQKEVDALRSSLEQAEKEVNTRAAALMGAQKQIEKEKAQNEELIKVHTQADADKNSVIAKLQTKNTQISERIKELERSAMSEEELEKLKEQLILVELDLFMCKSEGHRFKELYNQTKDDYTISSFNGIRRRIAINKFKNKPQLQDYIKNKFKYMKEHDRAAESNVFQTLDNYFSHVKNNKFKISIPNRRSRLFLLKNFDESFIQLFFDEMFNLFFPPDDLKKEITELTIDVLTGIYDGRNDAFTNSKYQTITTKPFTRFIFLQEYLKWKKHVTGGDIKTEINNIINKMVEQNGIIGGSEKKIQQIKDNVYNDIMLKISDLT